MMRRDVSFAVVFALCAATALAADESALKTSHTKDMIAVSRAEQKVVVYRFAASPQKPYIKELYTPQGVQVLRDAPHDHLHHHGAMFAVAVDGVDYWAEGPKFGSQKPKRRAAPGTADERPIYVSPSVDLASLVLQQDLLWEDASAARQADEERSISVRQKDEGATLVTWHTRLSPAEGKPSIKLTGSHYFGLGVRFIESMDKDGAFVNAANDAGENVRGKEFLVKAKWAAYTAQADGKPVTVAVFDHPKNPRHPARIFTMAGPFAYLGPTLNLWKEPLELKAGETLDLRYGLAAWDGKVDAKQIEELYEKWATGM